MHSYGEEGRVVSSRVSKRVFRAATSNTHPLRMKICFVSRRIFKVAIDARFINPI